MVTPTSRLGRRSVTPITGACLVAAALSFGGCEDKQAEPTAAAEPVAADEKKASDRTPPSGQDLLDEAAGKQPAAAKPTAAKPADPKGAGSEASAAEPTAEKSGSASKSRPSGSTTLVRLLSPGKEPRKELRYRYVPKSSERMKVTTDAAMTMMLNNFPNPKQVMPAVQMTVSIDVLDVGKDGTASRKMTIGSIGIAETEARGSPYAKVAARQLQALEGLVGRDRVTDRGIVLDPSLDDRTLKQEKFQGMFGSMQRSIAQMAAPLPSQPVGIGAKWEVVSRVTQFGVYLMQTATYELVKLDGDQGELRLELVQDRPVGEMRIPGMAPTAHSKLMDMGAKGTGAIFFDLDETVPRGKLESVVVAESVGDLRGTPSKMTVRMQYRAVYEPAD